MERNVLEIADITDVKKIRAALAQIQDADLAALKAGAPETAQGRLELEGEYDPTEDVLIVGYDLEMPSGYVLEALLVGFISPNQEALLASTLQMFDWRGGTKTRQVIGALARNDLRAYTGRTVPAAAVALGTDGERRIRIEDAIEIPIRRPV